MRLKVDSKALAEAIMRSGLHQWEAAKLAGISNYALMQMLKKDKKIQTVTAGKLRKAFGEDVVYWEETP